MKNPDQMPLFGLNHYADILSALVSVGYTFKTVREYEAEDRLVAYMRHDVDFFLSPAVSMAKLEAAHGLKSTYYVLLSGPYNCYQKENRESLRQLREMGHEIGLHYDLAAYPSPSPEYLDAEIEALARLIDGEVRSISLHNPHTYDKDPFLNHDELLNPRSLDFLQDLIYISDSCRIWRDDTLLECMMAPVPIARRLMLLTHPELWLDPTITDNVTYLNERILPRAVGPIQSYYCEDVLRIWMKRKKQLEVCS